MKSMLILLPIMLVLPMPQERVMAEVSGGSRSVVLQPVVSGLQDPLGIVTAGDGSGRLFIVLQGGQIVVFDGSQVFQTPFLDIQGRVSTGAEQGLLGLTFHPDYTANGFFYINYTDTSGATVISRFTVSVEPDVADASSELRILTIEQPFANHNGGQLQFGPDGFLYIGMGDGGGVGDPGNLAQNLGELLGKMLRVDVNGDDFPSDSERNYAIPTDNPFVDDPQARDEIWAYGLRNPWRFSFDKLTGDLFIADVGQFKWEEVNVQAASTPGGEN